MREGFADAMAPLFVLISSMQKTVMLLGSVELGKEVVIALQRYGHRVIAVDADPGAPAMRATDECEVISRAGMKKPAPKGKRVCCFVARRDTN